MSGNAGEISKVLQSLPQEIFISLFFDDSLILWFQVVEINIFMQSSSLISTKITVIKTTTEDPKVCRTNLIK